MRRILAGLVMLIVTILVVPRANAGEPTQGQPYNWYARHRNPEAVGFDILTLFLALDSKGLLPFEDFTDNQGKLVAEIMRDRSHFIGPSFPPTLDGFLCTHNQHVCKAVLDPRTHSQHFLWKGGAGTTYRLPDIHFERLPNSTRYHKTRGERVEQIVTKTLLGCEVFDASCRQSVINQNPRVPNPLDPAFKGDLNLPSLAVAAVVPNVDRLAVEPSPEEPKGREASHYLTDKDLSRESHEEDLHAVYRSGKIPATKAVDSAVRKNMPIMTPYKIEGVTDPHYRTHQVQLFRLLGHPLPALDNLEENIIRSTIEKDFKNTVTVAVLDTWVDSTHCEFAGDRRIYQFNNKMGITKGQLDPRGDCSTVDEGATARDHGTHVSGLIGAKMNGIGIVGINPLAMLVTYEADGALPLEVARNIHSAISGDRARVINVSMSNAYSRMGSDPVIDLIKDYSHDVLFVVAAGDDGSTADGSCVRFPACYYNEPNVVTVVALDSAEAAPKRWEEGGKGSNYGKVFHIGAPGAGIFSSIPEKGYGYMSGTSQAAPMVSGAASLLYARNLSLDAARIKERLIYTSEMFHGLETLVLGGRLHIGRLLDTDSTVVRLRDRGSQSEIRGRILRADQVVSFSTPAGSLGNPVSLRDLKRLLRWSDGPYPFLLFMTTPDEGGGRVLERHLAVTPVAGSSFEIKDDKTGAVRSVSVADVDDYVAALTE